VEYVSVVAQNRAQHVVLVAAMALDKLTGGIRHHECAERGCAATRAAPMSTERTVCEVCGRWIHDRPECIDEDDNPICAKCMDEARAAGALMQLGSDGEYHPVGSSGTETERNT